MTIKSLFSAATPHLRNRNRAMLGLVLSVLLHAFLFMSLRPNLQQGKTPERAQHEPLQVTFIQSVKPQPPVVQKAPDVKPAPPKKPAHPKTQAKLTPRASPVPQRQAVPVTTSPTAIASAPPEMDMSNMLEAARERRRSAEADAARENAAARAAEQGPSANEIARANIAFQQRKANGGTNGVFEIVSKGPRVAQYVFRGWTTDARRSQRQTITVDAGLNGDVEKAIIDSMIGLIRQYYSGDFNWDSHRLGRVVTLSARLTDTAGLQAFLLREFFG